MTVSGYFRKSTNQWVYCADGVSRSNNFTFRYSHKYRFVAYLIYKTSINKDLKQLTKPN